MSKKIFFILSITLFIATACGLNQTQETSEKAKIMVVLPVGLPVGQQMANAAQLALDQYNSETGKPPVEIVLVDDYIPDAPRDFSKDIQAAQQAAADQAVVAFLGGSSSSRAREVLATLNTASIPMISPSSTWPGLTMEGFGVGEPSVYYPGGERTFFRVIPNDSLQGIVAIQWMQQQGHEKVYIVAMDDFYSKGLAGIVEANAPDENLTIVGNEVHHPLEITPEQIDELVARIVEAEADVLYYPVINTGDGYPLIQALLETDPDIVIMGGDSLTAEELPEGVTELDRLYATNINTRLEDMPASQEFISAYEAAYGTLAPDTTLHPFALLTYESMNVLLKAIENANTPNRSGVLDALQTLGEYSGVMGTWSFDENGDTTLTSISIMELQNGEWVVTDVIR